MSSQLSGNLTTTPTGLRVTGSEELKYNFHYISDVFNTQHAKLGETYKPWGRVLVVLDQTVAGIYKDKIEAYFAHFKLPASFKVIKGGEINKNMDTFEEIVEFLDAEGLVRQEPVLVVGGGLVTDVTGYVCASYRRSSNFIRVPTTLIGLIDAAVSIKVGLNHKKLKNRLGAYHAPIDTYLDFSFLKTLPKGQIRNGTSELVKIATVSEKRCWDILVKHGKELIEHHYGYEEGYEHLIPIGEELCKRGIEEMLELEAGNLHELMLDRVIAFGHSWSPVLELSTSIPLRHGSAIMVDMAYSMTLAHSRGLVSEAERDQWFDTITSFGTAIDHENFNEELLHKSTEAIKKTRNGLTRLAVTDGQIGKCRFINDASYEELNKVLKIHKAYVQSRYPGYQAQEQYVDTGDLGQNVDQYLAEKNGSANGAEAQDGTNGTAPSLKKVTNGISKAAVSAGAAVVDGGKIVNGSTGHA